MGYKINGTPLAIGVAFTDSAGINYPKGWLRRSTESARTAIGITWTADSTSTVDKAFYNPDGSAKAVAGLKTEYITQQKEAANNLLAVSDWLITRKAEIGTAVPSDTTTYRAAVRTKCKEREDQITACSDTDALCALIRASSHVAGTASNGADEEKKEDGASYDPKQWKPIVNPAALKAWPES